MRRLLLALGLLLGTGMTGAVRVLPIPAKVLKAWRNILPEMAASEIPCTPPRADRVCALANGDYTTARMYIQDHPEFRPVGQWEKYPNGYGAVYRVYGENYAVLFAQAQNGKFLAFGRIQS
jgi:hypothetical protein